MPKDFSFKDDGKFNLTIEDEAGEVKKSAEPQDIWKCHIQVCEVFNENRDAPAADRWDAVCDVMEKWGAGRPSHKIAQLLWARLNEEVEGVKKKDGSEAGSSA